MADVQPNGSCHNGRDSAEMAQTYDQCPFQEPKLEVATIGPVEDLVLRPGLKAYGSGNISQNMA